jgi:hypothetical protein
MVKRTDNVGRENLVQQERETLLRLSCTYKYTSKGESSSFDATVHSKSVSRSGGRYYDTNERSSEPGGARRKGAASQGQHGLQ